MGLPTLSTDNLYGYYQETGDIDKAWELMLECWPDNGQYEGKRYAMIARVMRWSKEACGNGYNAV